MPKRNRLRNLLSAVGGPWKQKHEPTQVEPEAGTSSPASAVCDLCRNLDPNDSEFRDLFMWSSSLAGAPPHTCPFCRFIYETATAMVPAFASGHDIHASVESVPSRNKLNLRFGGRLAVQIYTRDHGCDSPTSNTGNGDDTFAFATEQLQHCKQHHAICAQRSPTFQPTRLIHCAGSTDNLRLVELESATSTSSPVEYVALSYCWGASASFKTTRKNIEELKQAFKLSNLPKSLQDAIEVTRKLGIEHIWIDAICIVQGDAADWEKESGMMADIYNNAYVTIAALSAAASAEGFLHVRRQPLQISRSWSDEDGATTTLVAQEKIRTGLHASTLRNNRGPTMGTQEGDFDPVQTRGWCFQEEVLSKRYLAFSRQEMQWSCKVASACQCGSLDHGENTSVYREALGIQNDPFKFWAEEVLPFYTQRTLSFAKDRLPAISGLARAIQRTTSADYVAGIWLQDLTRSLNWKPRDDIKPCPSVYRAPSFSWASIDSPISMAGKPVSDIVSVVSWDVQPERKDPLGEIKYASLTLNGFVHAATVTHQPESYSGFEFRVTIAGQRAVLDDDTHLVKFQTKRSDGADIWSVRRSNDEVKHVEEEWGSGVVAQALCLVVNEEAAEFLILGQCVNDATKLIRIGSVMFTAVTDSYAAFAQEVTRDCYRKTITLV